MLFFRRPLAHDVQVIGPFARSVADLTSVYAAIADRPFQSELPRRLRIGAFVRFPERRAVIIILSDEHNFDARAIAERISERLLH